MVRPFSAALNQKIAHLEKRRTACRLGGPHFKSPLILAPMAAICNAPFRLLMQLLGAGGTVSELISCHGINHRNERTLNMLKLHPREKRVGIQLFGEDALAMGRAAAFVEETSKPDFIDLNLGCPVKKVVSRGGGSALLQDPSQLGRYFAQIKKQITIPLTVKIRTGWDVNSINADEILKIAKEEGLSFVAVHGRTRSQQYTGSADWIYLESLAALEIIPVLGNGDLHSPTLVRDKLEHSNCNGLMLARGALRHPFIFLESFLNDDEPSPFQGLDYWEILVYLQELMKEEFQCERHVLVQLRKIAVWFASGLPKAANFRSQVFQSDNLQDCLRIIQRFFVEECGHHKAIDYEDGFMMGGHG